MLTGQEYGGRRDVLGRADAARVNIGVQSSCSEKNSECFLVLAVLARSIILSLLWLLLAGAFCRRAPPLPALLTPLVSSASSFANSALGSICSIAAFCFKKDC
jgi:hypothetical protein